MHQIYYMRTYGNTEISKTFYKHLRDQVNALLFRTRTKKEWKGNNLRY